MPEYLLITDPQTRLVVERLQQLSEAERTGFVRLCIRILNNDKKVLRLIAMRDAGQITDRQLLSMV